MKHLTATDKGIPVDRMLANWATVSSIIYDATITTDTLKALLRHEALTKDRPMIIERLITRLLSVMKQDLKTELYDDLEEIYARVRKDDREVLESED